MEYLLFFTLIHKLEKKQYRNHLIYSRHQIIIPLNYIVKPNYLESIEIGWSDRIRETGIKDKV